MSEIARSETPLYYLQGSQRGPVETSPGLTVLEAPLSQHLSIRGNSESAGFKEAVRSVTGMTLPTRPLSCERHANVRIFWQGPSEWLLIVDGPGGESMESDMRRALIGERAAVVDVSGGQTLLTLSGPALSEVLQKSSPYDFHASNFPVGKCVQTTFGKAGGLVARQEEEHVTLVLRRSFADYVGKWLLEAAAEQGVQIAG
jgi:sarcosine oxidase, subunit gamma